MSMYTTKIREIFQNAFVKKPKNVSTSDQKLIFTYAPKIVMAFGTHLDVCAYLCWYIWEQRNIDIQ